MTPEEFNQNSKFKIGEDLLDYVITDQILQHSETLNVDDDL